jgi:hypothetical protein
MEEANEMWKKRDRRMGKSTNEKRSRRRGRTNIVIAAALCLTIAGGALAKWKGLSPLGVFHTSTTTRAPLPPAPSGLAPSTSPSSPAKEYVYAGGRLLATEEPTSTSTNNAQFSTQSVPTAMIAGQTYQVSVKMNNTGSTTWSSGSSYALGSQNPANNTTWLSATRVPLPNPVAPGASATFAFTVTAPATAATYNFQWQMVQDNAQSPWFGDFSPNVAVTVSPAPQNDAQFESQLMLSSMMTGQTYSAVVRMNNRGNTAWTYQPGASSNDELACVSSQCWGVSNGNVPIYETVNPGQDIYFWFDVTAPSVPGTYHFQWRMYEPGAGYFGDYTPDVTVTVSAPSNGTLSGGVAFPASAVNLTQEGVLDWAHWGLTASSSFDHKAGVSQGISNYSVIGTANIGLYGDNHTAFTWSDGVTTQGGVQSATGTTTGVFVNLVGNGFRITAPADTTARTLRVYVGVSDAQGTLTANLSDGSAPFYTDSTVNNTGGNNYGVYTISYSAASSGQTLIVNYTLKSDYGPGEGNITLQAATLCYSPVTGGSIAGSKAVPSTAVNLTQQGTADWAHWSLTSPGSCDDKANVPSQISTYIGTGPNNPGWYGDNSFAYTWNDGNPNATASTTNGSFVTGVGNGFRLTVPADTMSRSLTVYVGAWYAQGRFEARLSDASAGAYVDTTVDSSSGSAVYGAYTITYKAASAGQLLTITYTLLTDHNPPNGNVTLASATLSDSTGGTLGAPTALTATVTSSAGVRLQWTAPTTGAVDHYVVERRQSVSGAFTPLSGNPTTTNYTDSSGSGITAYLYRVRAVDSSGNYSAYSNVVMATTIVFADEPLVAGATKIKAQHLTDLRNAVNAVRTTAALGVANWQHPPTLTPGSTVVSAADVQELRDSLGPALTVLGITPPGYTDSPLTTGVTIKAAHIEQLRKAVNGYYIGP